MTESCLFLFEDRSILITEMFELNKKIECIKNNSLINDDGRYICMTCEEILKFYLWKYISVKIWNE